MFIQIAVERKVETEVEVEVLINKCSHILCL